MPEDIRASEELIDVGETVGADINLDEKGEPVKQEEVVEEKIEVEEIPQDKTFEKKKKLKLNLKKKKMS